MWAGTHWKGEREDYPQAVFVTNLEYLLILLEEGQMKKEEIPGLTVLLAPFPLPMPPMLSPRVKMEMPLKLLALVTGGRRLRVEPSESVLLHGRGSRDFISLSVLLWRLPEARLSPSRLPLYQGWQGLKSSWTRKGTACLNIQDVNVLVLEQQTNEHR